MSCRRIGAVCYPSRLVQWYLAHGQTTGNGADKRVPERTPQKILQALTAVPINYWSLQYWSFRGRGHKTCTCPHLKESQRFFHPPQRPPTHLAEPGDGRVVYAETARSQSSRALPRTTPTNVREFSEARSYGEERFVQSRQNGHTDFRSCTFFCIGKGLLGTAQPFLLIHNNF